MWAAGNHSTAEYGYAKLQGHGVYLSPEAMSEQALMNQVLVRLDADLKKIHELLPPAAMQALKDVSFDVRRGEVMGFVGGLLPAFRASRMAITRALREA